MARVRCEFFFVTLSKCTDISFCYPFLQATLLLLEVLALDVDKPLELLAAGADVTPDTIPFLAPDVESSVDKELQSWWPIARSAHGPIFLIWSAFLTLGGRQGAEEYAGKASEVGALGALCRLSSTQGLHPSAAEMAGTIMFSSMAAVLAAYGLEPLSIGVPATEQVVTVLVNIFQGQERLCSSFWEDPDAVSNQPIRHFLDGLAELFPALPVPMLRLLKALATGQSAAAHANAYLANMARLCSLHTLPDSAIAAYPNDSGAIVTEHALLMPGAPTLSIPAGVVGEILELPPEAPGGWTSGPEHVTDSQHLIKWRLSVPEGTAQWVLLCRSFGALRAVQTWRSAAALAELDAALGLLAALCAGDAGTALDLLHVEAPAGEGAGAEGVRGADALVLASQTVAVLAEAIAQQQFDDPGPASSALAHALKLCMAYASAAPGRVGQELCSALGVSPLNTSLATLVPGGTQEPALLRAFIMGEGAGRQYAATQALLQLLSALVQAACPTPSLAALVAFVLQRVMPEMHHWRFDDWTERWRLATLCLTLTRHVLLLASSEGSSASPVAAVVTSVLQTDAGAAACLLPLAPPEASALESMAQNRQFAREAEAAETCCIAWLRLIPVLLPLASPDAALAAGPLLRSGMDGGRPVAATLLSFLLYPYFSTRERTLVVRCLHCFAVAAARVVSDMPLVALLPQGAAGLSPAAKAVFELAVGPVGARSSQGLFGATCDVLVASIKHHASLLDALMFPSEMATSADKVRHGAVCSMLLVWR